MAETATQDAAVRGDEPVVAGCGRIEVRKDPDECKTGHEPAAKTGRCHICEMKSVDSDVVSPPVSDRLEMLLELLQPLLTLMNVRVNEHFGIMLMEKLPRPIPTKITLSMLGKALTALAKSSATEIKTWAEAEALAMAKARARTDADVEAKADAETDAVGDTATTDTPPLSFGSDSPDMTPNKLLTVLNNLLGDDPSLSPECSTLKTCIRDLLGHFTDAIDGWLGYDITSAVHDIIDAVMDPFKALYTWHICYGQNVFKLPDGLLIKVIMHCHELRDSIRDICVFTETAIREQRLLEAETGTCKHCGSHLRVRLVPGYPRLNLFQNVFQFWYPDITNAFPDCTYEQKKAIRTWFLFSSMCKKPLITCPKHECPNKYSYQYLKLALDPWAAIYGDEILFPSFAALRKVELPPYLTVNIKRSTQKYLRKRAGWVGIVPSPKPPLVPAPTKSHLTAEAPEWTPWSFSTFAHPAGTASGPSRPTPTPVPASAPAVVTHLTESAYGPSRPWAPAWTPPTYPTFTPSPSTGVAHGPSRPAHPSWVKG